MKRKGFVVPVREVKKRKKREGWIPYASEDMKWDGAKELVEKLKKNGKYEDVEVRRRKPERGVRYGRIYVKPKI